MKRNNLITALALTFIATASLYLASCNKKVVAPVAGKEVQKVDIPFHSEEYRTNNSFIRYVQSHQSPDLSVARSRALLKAQAGVAQMINSLVKSVSSDYLNERQLNEKGDFSDNYNNLTMLVVKEQLAGVRIIGEEVFRDSDNNEYTCFVAVELPVGGLYESTGKKISAQERAHLEFDEVRFRRIFDAEMEKLEKEVKDE